jgi:hypothetical protein
MRHQRETAGFMRASDGACNQRQSKSAPKVRREEMILGSWDIKARIDLI